MFGIGFIIIAVIIVVALLILFSFVPIGLWISAIAAGVHVGIGTLVGMRLRRVSPRKVIAPLIKAHKAGLKLTTNQLESHYLAGGNVDRVVDANIAAQRADIDLPFERGAAIDLAGRDVLEAVQMSVNPKVIETPFIAGVAMNGIEVKAKARLRRVSPRKVIAPLIKAHKAGLKLTTNQLESHYLAGGNVDRVVDANIAAQRADIDLPFERGAAIDLAGRDVLEAVQMSVNPKVIETPFIAGVAMNGIEVKAKARITVRANIARLVGGAGEETIIARVGEGIVSTIGSSEHHTEVLENPDNISKTVLSKGLDSGTAFEILSIDIADVDISKNIGADLQTEQALADKNIAQAKAEERRAMAVASEQEMKARVQEMRAKVVEAESEVPLAMAEALRSGNIGVKDYYNLKNIEADTGMRNAINKRTDQNDDESPEQ